MKRLLCKWFGHRYEVKRTSIFGFTTDGYVCSRCEHTHIIILEPPVEKIPEFVFLSHASINSFLVGESERTH